MKGSRRAKDPKNLSEHERRLVMSISKLSKAGVLRVLAAAGCVIDEGERTNSIGVPGCMGAAASGPYGCTCRFRCCMPATDELAARWWGYADSEDEADELDRLQKAQAAERRRERRLRKAAAANALEREQALASGRLLILSDFTGR